MRTYTLRCELLVKKSITETFKVFEDAHNLAKLTPSWLNFQVTTPGRIDMRPGINITYKIKWLGLPLNWKTLISEYEPPFLFVDEQQEGPYTLWRHRHTFQPANEGTIVKDQVDYALPLGILGEIAHRTLVQRQLLAIFRYRQQKLAEMFGAGTREVLRPAIKLSQPTAG